jgi:hypothetical protein
VPRSRLCRSSATERRSAGNCRRRCREVSHDGTRRIAVGNWGPFAAFAVVAGTARYPSLAVLQQAIAAAGCETVTVSLRRESASERAGSRFWTTIKELGVQVLPNTAGCKTVKEALTTAEMGREIFETSWVKLEVIGDDYTLQPHPVSAGRGGRSPVPAGVSGLSVHHGRSGGGRTAGSGRLLDPDAVGCAHRFRSGPEQSLRAAHPARPLPGSRVDRGRRNRQTFSRPSRRWNWATTGCWSTPPSLARPIRSRWGALLVWRSSPVGWLTSPARCRCRKWPSRAHRSPVRRFGINPRATYFNENGRQLWFLSRGR